jgi:hypothetical protein
VIELVVEDNATPYLSVLVERMSDFSAPLTKILEDGLFSGQEQVVEGKGGMFGRSAWPPMAASTIRKGRDPATLLVERGGLLLSLSRGADGNIFEVEPSEGTAGTGLVSSRNAFPYPAWQQKGTKSYPPRPYLAWYEERFPAYNAFIGDWIMEGVA